MLVLCLRTDKPVAEVYIYEDSKKLAEMKWEAHRKLADTLHKRIDKIFSENKLSLQQINKLIIFEGPGSFTGLRIGFSVANAIGYSQNTPVIAVGGKNWIIRGLEIDIKDFKPAQPVYGGDPHITKQKK